METIKKVTEEQRKAQRIPMEPGSTVIIQCGDHEVVGTLEDRSDGGLGLRIDTAVTPLLNNQNKNITVTYSMPYGVISQGAEIAWVRSEGNDVRIGAAFIQNEEGVQSGFQKNRTYAQKLDR
jgi:hypothetical protein